MGEAAPKDGGEGRALLAAAARKRASSTGLQPRSALEGIAPGPTGPWTPWNISALVMGVLLIVGSLLSLSWVPKPQRFSSVQVRFVDGPKIPDAEVIKWIRLFPFSRQLSQPNEWVLHQLAEHLKTWTAVAEVPQVRLVHQRVPVAVVMKGKDGRPVRSSMDAVRRVLEVSLCLRQPFLPGVLEDGTRVWIDRQGLILPGILPRPEVQRPVVRAIRAGGVEGLKAATRLWALLEPQIERGLITDIVLSEPLDAPTAAPLPTLATGVTPAAAPVVRGIVLHTRTGGRIVWGTPAEERFGISTEDKVANLVHTLRCQGDLTRLAMVNVRFREPYYTIR